MSISSRKVGVSYQGNQKKKGLGFFQLLFLILLAVLGYYSFDFYQKETKARRDPLKSFQKLVQEKIAHFKKTKAKDKIPNNSVFIAKPKESLLKVFKPKKETPNPKKIAKPAKKTALKLKRSEKKVKQLEPAQPKVQKAKIPNNFQAEKTRFITDYQNSVAAFNFALRQIQKRNFALERIILNDYQYGGTTVIKAKNQRGNRLMVSYQGNSQEQTFWKITSYLN